MQGFPDSVTPDYVGFQLWDTLQVCVIIIPVCLMAGYSNNWGFLFFFFLFPAGPLNVYKDDAFNSGEIKFLSSWFLSCCSVC